MNKTKDEIIDKLNVLIHSKGYFYALCMILFEDFHEHFENPQKVDNTKKLSFNEAAFLIGLLIKDNIDFSKPDKILDLIKLKDHTYQLMDELHQEYNSLFYESVKSFLPANIKDNNKNVLPVDLFKQGKLFVEPIFYSGSGVFDFQYLDFMNKKYIYDDNWLIKNKGFGINDITRILLKIRSILNDKSQKVNLLDSQKLMTAIRKMPSNSDSVNQVIIGALKIWQYLELFFDVDQHPEIENIEDIYQIPPKLFYHNLVDLFCIRKTDFIDAAVFDSFIENFSVSFGNYHNKEFNSIGDYNIIYSKPIIKLEEDRFFVPVLFLLYKAVYESPFYWMFDDADYHAKSLDNRGKVGEEITFDFLKEVFGSKSTYKSVKVKTYETEYSTKRLKDITDIDVLCFLGNKALCVQVKSKRLTELSRRGNDDRLKKDFKEAVQDAYEQGLKVRKCLLTNDMRFYDEYNYEITIPNNIKDVYLLCVIMENYPALTHQTNIMLEIKNKDTSPLVLTVFDLELLVHYLSDPYDFLYYVKQRTSLLDYFYAEEEMIFLGYHLQEKLWKYEESDITLITNDFGERIVQDYTAKRSNMKIEDNEPEFKTISGNDKFSQLCRELKNIQSSEIAEIIFSLLDFNSDTREELIELIFKSKDMTKADGSSHNFTQGFGETDSLNLGITYFSYNSNNSVNLKKSLSNFCQIKKNKHNAKKWIGLGSFKNSKNLIDVAYFY